MDFKTDQFGVMRGLGDVPGQALLLVNGSGVCPVPDETTERITNSPAGRPLFTLSISGVRAVQCGPVAEEISVSVFNLGQLAALYAHIGDIVETLPGDVRARWVHAVDQHGGHMRRSREAAGDWMKP